MLGSCFIHYIIYVTHEFESQKGTDCFLQRTASVFSYINIERGGKRFLL
uniref:Uncharacterized protein n=1 Tax=Rhizophora mucronata TaxID=61149 RepID=A0A2P2JEQ7_RHIMU